MIDRESMKLQKESDKVRKSFKDKDLNVDQFIQNYVKSRTQFYETEIIKNKVNQMAAMY